VDCKSLLRLNLWDGDLALECYSRAYKSIPVPAPFPTTAWRILVEFAMLGGRRLFDAYLDSATGASSEFKDPEWAAGLSAFLAEDTYNAFVNPNTRSKEWRKLFSAGDYPMPAQPGFQDLVSFGFVSRAFGTAHLREPLTRYLVNQPSLSTPDIDCLLQAREQFVSMIVSTLQFSSLTRGGFSYLPDAIVMNQMTGQFAANLRESFNAGLRDFGFVF